MERVRGGARRGTDWGKRRIVVSRPFIRTSAPAAIGSEGDARCRGLVRVKLCLSLPDEIIVG
jgi:hypothetical protein